MSGPDPFSPEKRRSIMQSVRREDTAPEMRLRKALWGAGLRYRKQRRVLDAKPDICFVGPQVAVFVDGCFWHGCPDHYKPPLSNRDYWLAKLERNRARDRKNDRDLADAGWLVLRFWECQVKQNLEGVVAKVHTALGRLGSSPLT